MNTLSRHDAPSVLLHLVECFLEEVYSDFQDTEPFKQYQKQYEESFNQAVNSLWILKEKLGQSPGNGVA